MEIRLAEPAHIPVIVAIYDKARAFMHRSGNPHQWRCGYPSAESLLRDIDRKGSYVCIEEGRIVATFFFIVGEEPTYRIIREGGWLNNQPYGVIHRVASDGTVKGVMHKILDFCFQRIPNIRIDTHHDNRVMRESLLRYGFRPCGVINVADGSERDAYQMTSDKTDSANACGTANDASGTSADTTDTACDTAAKTSFGTPSDAH